jgi:hypothetical protein
MFKKILTVITCLSSLTACSNAISYHHSERSSIALEARSTDPQQPIQGIIGVKTRTIVVAPGISVPTTVPGMSDNGEATSLISDFKIDRVPNALSLFDSTVIRSAFITGDAAKVATKAVTTAISGIDTDSN